VIRILGFAFAMQAVFAAAASGGVRVSFTRTIPAAHELAGHNVAVIYAIGDNEKVTSFLDVFLEHLNRSEGYRADDATHGTQHIHADVPDEAAFLKLRREHPADAYIGINHFTCVPVEREGEGSMRTVDGVRVKRRQLWVDATCSARIDLIDATTRRRLSSFDVKGEGTSPRVEAVTDEERGIAYEQAARFAAIQASEAVTPRTIRESVELDESAPSYDTIVPLIDQGKLDQARAECYRALRKQLDSAPLHFNAAALNEALGDLPAAQRHYEEAQRLAPQESRYRTGLLMFRRRTAPRR
jgi:tetratricopeptide (TPR) repeat protein